MNNKVLQATELTKDTFSEFGDVMEATGDYQEINEGTTKRFHDLASIDVLGNSGQPLFNIFQTTPATRPVAIKLLERHPLSSQAFFPLENKPFLIVVAPPGDKIDINDIRAFVSNGKQGVNYHRNVWHHPILALDEETSFIVIDRGGTELNCEEYYFAEDVEITIDW